MNGVKDILGIVYNLRRKINSEETFLRKTLQKRASRGEKLLDVGCGFSRFYEIIDQQGISYTGVEVNPETVQHNRALGRNVFSVDEFDSTLNSFDILLLSHIIEHFGHQSLIAFLNSYLKRLNVGGIIVIFTPLYHRGFYDDFDHVKPYSPSAARQIFCHSATQTQGTGLIGKYAELDLWFKRDPLWHSHANRKWQHLIEVPLTLACSLSYGVVGKLTGYAMVLRRVE